MSRSCRLSPCCVPLAYYFQGVYRLRRGRSRVDDFFLVFIGTVVAVILGVVTTLYVDAYHASPEEQAVGAYQVSRIVWALFLVINIVLTFGSRELVREMLERRWKAGIGLKRILIAGAGDLGRVVAEKILQHGELGYQVWASSTIARAAITSAIAACRCSARWLMRRRSSARKTSTICTWRCRSTST